MSTVQDGTAVGGDVEARAGRVAPGTDLRGVAREDGCREPAGQGLQVGRVGAEQVCERQGGRSEGAQAVQDRTRLPDACCGVGIDVDVVPVAGQAVESGLIGIGRQSADDGRVPLGCGRRRRAAIATESARAGGEQRPGGHEVVALDDHLEDRGAALVPDLADSRRHRDLAGPGQGSEHVETLGAVESGLRVERPECAQRIGCPLCQGQGEGGQDAEPVLEDQVEVGGAGADRQRVQDGVALVVADHSGAQVEATPPGGGRRRFGHRWRSLLVLTARV